VNLKNGVRVWTRMEHSSSIHCSEFLDYLNVFQEGFCDMEVISHSHNECKI
jgi:hypothetical protein